MKVAMRSIGHQILLAHGDSTSRVLPVQFEEGAYQVRFENEFQFNPSVIIQKIDDVLSPTNLTDHYIVEMKSCDADVTMYSYEVRGELDLTTIPCLEREQFKSCYILHLSVIDNEQNIMLGYSASPLWVVLILIALGLIGLGYYYLRKPNEESASNHVIGIGNYQFDPLKMLLSITGTETVLTGKESALLSMLTSSRNETIKKEDILLNVWGDQGDYVGRTLDVFISKLRKKLERDPQIKIANIRGIGYRLIVEEA